MKKALSRCGREPGYHCLELQAETQCRWTTSLSAPNHKKPASNVRRQAFTHENVSRIARRGVMFLPQTYVSDSHHADVWTSTHGSNRKGMATPRTSALPLPLSVCAFWNPHNGERMAARPKKAKKSAYIPQRLENTGLAVLSAMPENLREPSGNAG